MAQRVYQLFMLLVALIIGVIVGTQILDNNQMQSFINELQNFFKAMIPVLGTAALIKYLLS